eukprot:1392178-Amorphochlora_amoeboformis.AAC.6
MARNGSLREALTLGGKGSVHKHAAGLEGDFKVSTHGRQKSRFRTQMARIEMRGRKVGGGVWDTATYSPIALTFPEYTMISFSAMMRYWIMLASTRRSDSERLRMNGMVAWWAGKEGD